MDSLGVGLEHRMGQREFSGFALFSANLDLFSVLPGTAMYS